MDDFPTPPSQHGSSRFVTGAFGLLFVGLGIAVFLLSAEAPHPFWAGIAAVVLGAIGLEALVAALRNRRSLASRIGPLP